MRCKRIMQRLTAAAACLLLCPAVTAFAADDTTNENMQYAAGDVLRVYISTEENIGETLQKATGYVPARFVVVNPDGTLISDSGVVKVRGNSTAEAAKKPYTIKFDSKQDVLGMGEARKFVLLANCLDPTILRNYTAFELAKELELTYSSEHAFTEVWVDGVYKGCYELTEPVQAGKFRVNIDTESNDGMQDFLVQYEFSRTDAGSVYFMAEDFRFELKEPENAGENQLLYAQGVMRNIVGTVKRMDYAEIRNVIDTESFAKYYLLNEFFKPVDFGFSSVYFYYQNGMLYAGPPWDYDLAAGNVSSTESLNALKSVDTSGLFAAEQQFYAYLCQCPEFMEEVRQIYAAHHDYFAYIYAEGGLLESTRDTCAAVFERNFTDAGWNPAVRYWHLMRIPDATYKENFKYLQNWFRDRDIWLSGYFDIASLPAELLRGDPDGDGAVTAADSQRTLEAYLESLTGAEPTLTPEQTAAADIDGDGSITAMDSQLILLYYLNNTVAQNPVTWERLLADASAE